MLSTIKIWISSFRLRTLPLALASMLAGGYLVKTKHPELFNNSIFAFSCLTTILLQILSNLANDYGDAQNGADNTDRLGPQRVVSSGLISKFQMKTAIIIFSLLSLFSGIYLLFISFKKVDFNFVALLILGFFSIIAAIKYTAGKNPYGYKAYGDLSVMIFFGFIAVIGSYFLYTKTFECSTLFFAYSFGALATSVLNVNNIRDINTDIKANKITIANKLGLKNAVHYQLFLITSAAVSLISNILIENSSMVICLFILPLFIILFIKNKSLYTLESAEQQTNILKLTAILTFFISLILFLSTAF